MNVIQQLEKEQMAKLSAGKKIPDFGPGDTVVVNVKVVEGDRTRVQAYEGVCDHPGRTPGDPGRRHRAGGQILLLDMGEPVRILDLAADMIRLSGLRVGEDIAIQCVGTRPARSSSRSSAPTVRTTSQRASRRSSSSTTVRWTWPALPLRSRSSRRRPATPRTILPVSRMIPEYRGPAAGQPIRRAA